MSSQLTESRTLLIYADGSVVQNNIGGVGIRVIHTDSNGDEVQHDASSAGYSGVTSCQMEIIACRDALKEVSRQKLDIAIDRIVIKTDSKYVFDNHKMAMFQWNKNKWNNCNGRPLADAHLWEELNSQIKNFNKMHIYVDIEWVPGHGKDAHNREVDQMARKAARLPIPKSPKFGPVSIFTPKRVIASRKLEIGCVEMKGQRVSIKILAAALFEKQNIWRYEYQILTKSSLFFDRVDQIFCETALDVEKSYYVKFNSETKSPRIVKIYKTI